MRINQDQIILSRKKQFQFSYHRARGHVLAYLKNRAIWYYFPRFHILTDFPNHVDLEISSACDLKCPMCYTRSDEFKELVDNLAMQVAAMTPKFISNEEISEGANEDPQTACLLLQPYIKDPGMSIQDIIDEAIAKVGENIKVSRFARFEIGE